MVGSLKSSGESEKVNGLWKVPYLAEENADEDPEIQLTSATETAQQQKAKALLLKPGRKVGPSLQDTANLAFTGLFGLILRQSTR